MWDLIVSVPDHCLSFYFLFRPSVRGFSSHQCKYGGRVLFRNIERQKKKKKKKTNHRNFLGDRLELWPSKHTLQMVNNSKDKNGSVKLIESKKISNDQELIQSDQT